MYLCRLHYVSHIRIQYNHFLQNMITTSITIFPGLTSLASSWIILRTNSPMDVAISFRARYLDITFLPPAPCTRATIASSAACGVARSIPNHVMKQLLLVTAINNLCLTAGNPTREDSSLETLYSGEKPNQENKQTKIILYWLLIGS